MDYDLGKIYIKKKLFKKALKIFNEILKKDHKNIRAIFQIGKIYYESNDLNQSLVYFKKCNELQPKNSNIIFNLALALQGTGKINEAKKKYTELIKINHNDVKSYYGLYSLGIENITNELYKKLKKISIKEDISIFEKSLINFIFSKIEKKKKNYENEINYLNIFHKQCYEANLIFNNQSNFYYQYIISKKYKNIKFHNKFEPIPKFNNNKHIFIIGLPRSGSTLVETLITHNSERILSLGEFHGINTSILDQVGKKIYSKNFDNKNFQLELDEKIFQENLVEKYSNLENNLFLDKSLENFFNIEIILRFFPNAKIVHTYRDYKDSIIGIYQTMMPELSWSHRIQDIRNYIKIYQEIIEYFKKKYPDKIIDVELSKLTNEKEIETKKILRFCEIDLKKDFLNFNENKKLVNKTNSFLQVREKIKKYETNKYRSYYHLIK